MFDVCPLNSSKWSGPKLGWHKDDVNPHLAKFGHLLLGGDEGNGSSRVFVPLCGKTVDLAYLASHPKVSHVVGIDIVRNAAVEFSAEHPQFSMEEFQPDLGQCEGQSVEEKYCNTSDEGPSKSVFHGKSLTILIRDLFDFLAMDDSGRAKCITDGSHSVSENYLFDAIYDRASIVTIKPCLRKDYVRLIGEMLRPGGAILLVTLDRRKTSTDEARKGGPPFSIDEAEIRTLFGSQTWVESVGKLDEVNDLETDEDRDRWQKKGVLELYEIVFVIRKKK
ncbi:hypothetical protein ACHAWF_014564 [Thalassiosira exigua]